MDWNRLPLARATVDRAAHRRVEPDVVPEAWSRPGTRVMVVADGRLATRPAADGAVELELCSPADLAPQPPADTLVLFLGEMAPQGSTQDGSPHTGGAGPGPAGQGADDGTIRCLALVLPDVPSPEVDLEGVSTPVLGGLAARTTWATLRDVGHLLGDRDAGLAVAAVGLAAWHDRHPCCPLCGAPTVAAQGGWTRTCSVDGSNHYPRTDPAVIMAVLDDDDRLLLGHAAHWPERRFSTLAGYVEPGESLESAVRREVGEEVGVAVGEVSYRGSQPWPFPASLMLAFVARATTTEITVDGEEVTQARWFTREALATAVADGEVLLPMRTSVARALIEDWYGGVLEGPSAAPSRS